MPEPPIILLDFSAWPKLQHRARGIISVAAEFLKHEKNSVRGIQYHLFVNYPHLIWDMGEGCEGTVIHYMREARKRGYIGWDRIVDETRPLEEYPSWPTEEAFYADMRNDAFEKDHWATQAYRVQLWSEKATVKSWLTDIIETYHLPLMICHGNTSWPSLKRVVEQSIAYHQPIKLLYIGDHDPSGMNMTDSDLPTRIGYFTDLLGVSPGSVILKRVALLKKDCLRLKLPPNTEKEKEKRDKDTNRPLYAETYGRDEWELDAIQPDALRILVERAVRQEIDFKTWDRSHRNEVQIRRRVKARLA